MRPVVALSLALSLAPALASAQDARPRRWAFGLELGAGTMIHDFEHAGVDLGTPAVHVSGRFGLRLVGPLWLQFGGTYGQFVRERRDVQLAAGTLGLRAAFALGRRGHLWVDADAGVYLPGTVIRPGFDVGVGYAFDLGRFVSIGPALRFHHVWEGREGIGRFDLPYAPVAGQDTDSIHWWTLGVSVAFHPPPRPPRAPTPRGPTE